MKKLIVICSLIAHVYILPHVVPSESGRRGNSEGNSTAYNLLFRSNVKEFRNWLIRFNCNPPGWLHGTLYRNGPGLFEFKNTFQTHALDGFSKLLRIHFHGGTATFSTRFLNSFIYNTSKSAKRILPSLQVGPRDPGFDFVENIAGLLTGGDNTNINIKCLGRNRSSCLALSDLWEFYSFNAITLKTIGKIQPTPPVGKYAAESNSMFSKLSTMSSAHPLLLHNSSDYLTLVWDIPASTFIPFMPSAKLKVIRLHDFRNQTVIAAISRRYPSYTHSFALTKNYAVFFLDPIYIDLSGRSMKAVMLEYLKWKPQDGTDVLIVNINTGEFEEIHIARSYFHLHHVNAYEEDQSIYLDVVCYNSINIFKYLYRNIATNATERRKYYEKATLRRYKINLQLKTVVQRCPKLVPCRESVANNLDFPTINENFRHNKYCYIYGIVQTPDTYTMIVKKDLCGRSDCFWSQRNHFPSEAIFVPKPNTGVEDEGLLLSVVLDGFQQKSYVLILDAKNLKPVSKGYLPTYVPLSVHGHFVADSN